jgi:protein-S-isoprenylcysteine O-methyltransferase Ste14
MLINYLSLFFVPLFLVTVLVKKIMVQRKIGRSPLVFAERTTLIEAVTKRSVFLFFPLWLGGIAVFSVWPVQTGWIEFLHIQTTKIAGLFFIYISWAFFVICLIQMRDAWRFGIDQQQTSQLIKNGFYSKIRHPIYTSIQMAWVGSFLIYPHLYFLIITFVGMVGINLLAREEEKFLKKCFSEYEEYMKTTGRFLPMC